MKIKLTEKGKSTVRITLQGLGLEDADITILLDGKSVEVDDAVLKNLEAHKMAVKAGKKSEVSDGSGHV